jgi:Family of unknown function (DUF6629)
MCFSPQADVAGGLVICAIGIDAVRHVRQRCEFLALAWIHLLLGAHQFIEALVWLWLQGQVPRGIGHVALWAYLLIAFVMLPVFVPLAVIALEPTRRRRLMMVPFASTGTVIAVVLFAAMVRGPVGVKLAPYHLSYGLRVTDGLLVVVLYVVAVCGAHRSRDRERDPQRPDCGEAAVGQQPVEADGHAQPGDHVKDRRQQDVGEVQAVAPCQPHRHP